MTTRQKSVTEQIRPAPSEDAAERGLNTASSDQEDDAERFPLREDSSASSSIQISATSQENQGRKRIVIGEYEILFPREKLPLLGVMACAILLHISIFIDDKIYVSKYRYGFFLSMFAFFGALISTALPLKKTIPLNYCIFLCTFTGACMSTNEALSTLEAGPFEKPGNGYFSVWGLAICSGIAADPPGSLKRANFNSLLNLGAASLVVVLSLLPYVVHGSDNAVEVFICLSVAGLSIMTSSMFCLLKLCTWRSNHGNGGGQAVISTIIAILWIASACASTFRGPFTNVGNGYFASWFAVVMAVKVAALEWRNLKEKKKNVTV